MKKVVNIIDERNDEIIVRLNLGNGKVILKNGYRMTISEEDDFIAEYQEIKAATEGE